MSEAISGVLKFVVLFNKNLALEYIMIGLRFIKVFFPVFNWC